MYRTVLFDLDGTLTDPGEGITNSVAYALAKYGIDVQDKRTLYTFIGPPLYESFMIYYGFDRTQSEEAVEYYREYFRVKGMFENRVYDGVKEMLEALKDKNKTIILATSKPEVFAVQILQHFGLDKYFAVIAGSTLDGSRIKKADVIRYALDKCSITDTEATVMVGDREHDVLGAHACGLPAVGVLFGYGDAPELRAAGAEHIAATVGELQNLLLQE